MKSTDFKMIVQEQLARCCDLLNLKEEIYSDGVDRLYQFKTAAKILGCSPTFALGGMMVKHTTKLYQMIHDSNFGEGTKQFSEEQWLETISDSINYHFLLLALLIEEGACK
jgi:hypothetical protein